MGLFQTLGISMMTMFRCLTGDCSTHSGMPLILLLTDTYGPLFVITWVGVTMLVTFGIYNLIMAIYLEGTLTAAKNQYESLKAQKNDAIWVAKTTRSVVEKFCCAQRQIHDGQVLNMENVEMILQHSSSGDLLDPAIEIRKDTFLLVLQDPGVQKWMDALDIPPPRENLFDVLDADGNGHLGLRELIQGLMRVRGEPQRGDGLACVLAVRCAIKLLSDMQIDQKVTMRKMMNMLKKFTEHRDGSELTSNFPTIETEQINF